MGSKDPFLKPYSYSLTSLIQTFLIVPQDAEWVAWTMRKKIADGNGDSGGFHFFACERMGVFCGKTDFQRGRKETMVTEESLKNVMF
jgi:hypothetical protein